MDDQSVPTVPLARWIEEVDSVVVAVQQQYVELGRLIYLAETTLSHSDRQRAVAHLRVVGVSISDQRSARAAYLSLHLDQGAHDDLRIDPRLVFAGCRNNKMLNMSKQDQARLLSDEPFPIVSPNNKVLSKPWNEMRVYERNQLVARDGSIRGADEQRPKRVAPRSILPLTTVETILLDGDLLTFGSTTASLSCTVAEFAKMLGKDNLQRLANGRLEDCA